MGARLVSQVLARWTHVSERAFRVLVRMAVTALDEPHKGTPTGVYFGGRELLAMTLRSEKGTADTRYRTVKRALAELVEEGAIERTNVPRSGQNAVYRLTLDAARYIDEHPVDNPSDGPIQGDTSDPPEGDRRDPPQGDTRSPFRGTVETPPRNQEEPLDERGEEKVADLGTTSHPPRATAAETEEPISRLSKPTHCGHGLKIRYRSDGRPSCAMCRVAETRPGVAMPIPDDHLADVIPLHPEAM